MSSTDTSTTARIEDLEGGPVLFRAADGAEHTYYPRSTVVLSLQSLELVTSLRDGPSAGAEVASQVRGIATLQDRSISVAGAPSSKSRSLAVTLMAGTWRPANIEGGSGVGGASLGFNSADWELGTGDEWWACCYLQADFIEALAEEVRADRVAGVGLTLALQGR